MDMADSPMALSAFPDQPVYNIKAVCKRTGISAATLRAWERRHGLPSPNRTEQGYRLYSERDVAILFWLIQQLKSGVTIGQAAIQLHGMVNSGHDPEVHIPPLAATGYAETTKPRSPEVLRAELVEAFIQLDDRTADDLLTEAGALYTPETVLINVFQAAFHSLHEQPDASVSGTVTHFSLNYARQRLASMFQITPVSRGKRGVITIGFSSERNEIDLLILGVLLRRHGWPVTYLGSDLQPEMLGPALSNMNAAIIMFYVDDPANAERLSSLVAPVNRLGKPIHIVIGGRALLLRPELESQISAEYLGADMRAILRLLLERLLNEEEHGTVPNHEI